MGRFGEGISDENSGRGMLVQGEDGACVALKTWLKGITLPPILPSLTSGFRGSDGVVAAKLPEECPFFCEAGVRLTKR